MAITGFFFLTFGNYGTLLYASINWAWFNCCHFIILLRYRDLIYWCFMTFCWCFNIFQRICMMFYLKRDVVFVNFAFSWTHDKKLLLHCFLLQMLESYLTMGMGICERDLFCVVLYFSVQDFGCCTFVQVAFIYFSNSHSYQIYKNGRYKITQ